ncbi:MAG TPA: DUF2911 domain-containing protein [Vicinamibacterales bacterium]|nr:DUF2911 domain-containing protein [Vicinamibacterales bacterium]
MRTRTAAALAFLLVAIVVLACSTRAQGRRSPHERMPVVTVDGSEMFVEYGRPSVRGREIFGALIRWDEVWCPGADEATYLSTSKALKVGGLALPAGKYSLWIQPTKETWTLIFNSEWDTFHTAHRARADVGRVPMQKETLPENVEQLTFTIEPTKPGAGGRIAMSWATTKVSVPFTVE